MFASTFGESSAIASASSAYKLSKLRTADPSAAAAKNEDVFSNSDDDLFNSVPLSATAAVAAANGSVAALRTSGDTLLGATQMVSLLNRSSSGEEAIIEEQQHQQGARIGGSGNVPLKRQRISSLVDVNAGGGDGGGAGRDGSVILNGRREVTSTDYFEHFFSLPPHDSLLAKRLSLMGTKFQTRTLNI